tara:strand:- start:287 stop:535 length:249 start_codon:yes stop_codon:yes gene_type:complete
MKNEKQLVGQELVDFLMSRFNMTEDEALQNLAKNIGNVKLNEAPAKPLFKRLTAKQQVAEIEMIRLRQSLAGHAFCYSVIFN